MKHFKRGALLLMSAMLLGATMPAGLAVSPERAGDERLLAAETVLKARISSSDQILGRLISANKLPSTLHPDIQVQKSNVLNAYTNGQNIVVTSALLNRLHSDDEQAFVISHELSHIVLNHIGKTQARQVGLGLLNSLFLRRVTTQGSLAQLAGELGIGLVDKRSARGYEYQADDLGVRLMQTAGYQPKAALQVFQVLKANAGGSHTPEFLQDHPITDSRIRVLVQKYQLGQ